MMLHRGIGRLGTTGDVQALITQTATQYGVSPALALAVAKQESGYNQSARGAAGEVGVFQLMPGTAQGLGVDPYDLAQNVQGGVSYLAQMLARYGGDEATALWAYNAGPGNVSKGVEPASTRQYVASILAMEPSMIVDPTLTAQGGVREAMGPPEAPNSPPATSGAPTPVYDAGTGTWVVVPGVPEYTVDSGTSANSDSTDLLLLAGLAIMALVAID